MESACEVLGLDPLFAANEGKVVIIAEPGSAERSLTKIKSHPLGAEARVVGRVTGDSPGKVWLRTRIGGTRLLEPPSGELLPRIC